MALFPVKLYQFNHFNFGCIGYIILLQPYSVCVRYDLYLSNNSVATHNNLNDENENTKSTGCLNYAIIEDCINP